MKKHFFQAPELDVTLVETFCEIKKEVDLLAYQLKQRESQLDLLRTDILAQLPGDVQDKVDLDINGIILKKTSRDGAGGKLKGAAAVAFAKTKKFLSKVGKKEWVIDQKAFDDQVKQMIKEGKLSQEQYDDMIEHKWTPVLKIEDKRPCQSPLLDEESAEGITA